MKLTSSDSEQPVFLPDRAMENLQFIRQTMERATAYTGVSGLGQILVGGSALIAVWAASQQALVAHWIFVWLAEAVVSILISVSMMAKNQIA